LANKVKREEVKAAKDNLKAATLKNKAAQVEAAIEKADIISQQKEAEKNKAKATAADNRQKKEAEKQQKIDEKKKDCSRCTRG